MERDPFFLPLRPLVVDPAALALMGDWKAIMDHKLERDGELTGGCVIGIYVRRV